MTSYFLSPAAETDIDKIISHFADKNPVTARNFLDSLFTAMNQLAENPFMGHLREDLTNRPVRFWPFKWHYLIIYTTESPINIVRVISGKQDIIKLLA